MYISLLESSLKRRIILSRAFDLFGSSARTAIAKIEVGYFEIKTPDLRLTFGEQSLSRHTVVKTRKTWYYILLHVTS